jgi:hypothetical protein
LELLHQIGNLRRRDAAHAAAADKAAVAHHLFDLLHIVKVDALERFSVAATKRIQ